jgi:Hemerythrin HHE cation binding domain
MGPTPKRATEVLRTDQARILSSLHALAERVEKLHEESMLDQLALAREVVNFVNIQVAPHARAAEYSLYPAADWASGESSRLTEAVRFERQLITRRCQALEKGISAGAPAGRLMHLCYAVLALISAHFQVTEEVLLPYLDKAFDSSKFEKEVMTPLRMERGAKR